MQKPERSVNPSKLLHLFDKCTGIFVELFDSKLLLPAMTALIFYTVLFAQRKFPGRWMEFTALGMVLVGIVALAARMPGVPVRLRWHPLMAGLWFALHGWMLLAGCFNPDWLPDATALLLAYPFLFAVISAREDGSTFRAITRGAVFAVLPFLLWSLIKAPLVIDLEVGYSGVFYNQNLMAMCAGLMSVCALLLAYADWQQGRRKHALAYGAICALGALFILLSASRSAAVGYLGAVLVLGGCIALRHTRHVGRVVAALCCLTLIAGSALGYITWQKVRHNAEEDHKWSIFINETTDLGPDPNAPDPSERVYTLADFSSMRTTLWRFALQNLTWNGHQQSYIKEWVEHRGELHNRNAHNAFVQVAYNYGWPAGILFLLYVGFSAWRAWRYYWLRRRAEAMAIVPLLFTTLFILQGIFESIYTPFTPVCCVYLLVQGVLWRQSLSTPEERA